MARADQLAEAIFSAWPNEALRPYGCAWIMEGHRPRLTISEGGLRGRLTLYSTEWGTTRTLEFLSLLPADRATSFAIRDLIERLISELRDAPPFYV